MPTLTANDLMTAKVHTVSRRDSLAEAYDLIGDRKIRHLPVVDSNGDLVGLLSQRDMLRHALAGLTELPPSRIRDFLRDRRVEEVMVTGIETAAPDEDIQSVAERIFENKFGCLPVVEGESVVGIITEADFVRYVAEGGLDEPNAGSW
jgi:CBS domain-containing membrane protein